MMATTELEKIPETVLSRSQVYEFRTISTKAIAEQLRRIVDAEGIAVGDESLQLIARDAEGSMRDAQSKLDQVHRVHRQDDRRRRCRDGARAGRPRPAARHRAGGGRRGRAGGVRARRPRRRDGLRPARWSAASCRASCAICWCCRSIRRASSDPEIAGEGERDRLKALAAPLLARGSAARVRSADARGGRHPRRGAAALSPRDGAAAVDPPAQAGADRGSDRRRSAPARGQRRRRASASRRERSRRRCLAAAAAPPAPRRRACTRRPAAGAEHRRAASAPRASRSTWRQRAGCRRTCAAGAERDRPPTVRQFKDALLAEIRKSKAVFYNMVVAQAQKIEVAGDRVTFTFSPTQRALRDTFEQNRAWLEVDRRSRWPAARSPSSARAGRAGVPRSRRRRRRRRRRGQEGRARASRRSPTPACRRCSRCFPRKSATSRRCEP